MNRRSKHTIDVFNACVSGLSIGKPQVIDALTNTGYRSPESRDRLEEVGDRIAQQVPEVCQDAIDEFIENNTVMKSIENIYPIDERFIAITQEQMQTIFARDMANGWNDFRMRFPHTRGTMSVSDIGFDAAYCYAILYVGQQLGGLAGSGAYYVFERKQDGWSKLSEVGAWTS